MMPNDLVDGSILILIIGVVALTCFIVAVMVCAIHYRVGETNELLRFLIAQIHAIQAPCPSLPLVVDRRGQDGGVQIPTFQLLR